MMTYRILKRNGDFIELQAFHYCMNASGNHELVSIGEDGKNKYTIFKKDEVMGINPAPTTGGIQQASTH